MFIFMNPLRLAFLYTVLLALPLAAQMDLPGNPTVTPKNFKTRSVGGGANPGATVHTVEKPVRHVAHIVLFQNRMWTSSDGKPLEAKLLAFEDLVAEAPAGAPPVMPDPPALPTVVRDSSVRLMVGKKPVVVPLERLSTQDREFVANIEATLARQAAGGE
jgi:hypothetical protein